MYHILRFEVSLPRQYASLPPDEMFIRAKGMKNAYAVVPGDRGGPTLCGVTLATYTDYRRCNGHPVTTVTDLRAMTASEWLDIYKEMYWDRCRADEIHSQSVANMLVDWKWTSGTAGVKAAQRALGVPADGVVGPRTLAAINNAPNQRHLFNQLAAARHSFYRRIVQANPSQQKFLQGWLNRGNAIEYVG